MLLNAQARRTYKGVITAPRIVPPPGSESLNGAKKEVDGDVAMEEEQKKRPAAEQDTSVSKKIKK